jgi:hypothetical protein
MVNITYAGVLVIIFEKATVAVNEDVKVQLD